MAGFPRDIIPDNVLSPQELVAWFYERHIRTRPVESDYSVGTSVVALGAAVAPRLGYVLSNTGATNIAIGYSRTLTITTGFLLLPGGALTSSWYYDMEIVGYPLYAIGSIAGGTLHMMEQALSGV